MKCSLHPKYKIKRYPTSKKEGCICKLLWEAKINKTKLKEIKIAGITYIVEY